MWNEGIGIGKGYGGITILIRESRGKIVKVEKEDPSKQFIRFSITSNKVTARLVACYFSPKNPKFYKKTNLDNEDPFGALKRDTFAFRMLANIVLIRDFNARSKNNQSIQLGSDENMVNNLLWLEEIEDHAWTRTSQDGNGSVSHFGIELLGLCSLYDMFIFNGMKAWPRSGDITCKNYNGQSVVDYVICSQSLICNLSDFRIGACPIEMNSDHSPLFIKLGMHTSELQKV